ncbi:MAG TPA: NUDIX hydrolase [Candidatus Baltobacteraceae bacterium]|nr:NUDIX hydrolase [Candidatus Baltobacteraceae bacterium]
MNEEQWRILRSEYVIESPFLRLRSDEIELPGGTRVTDYFVRETRGYAMIFALTPDRRVVLVRQYKHGIGERVLELPAGGIDEGETPLDCAQRELAEETGFVGDPPKLIAEYIIDSTSSNGRCYLFAVTNAEQRLPQDLDLTESIEVELVTIDELRNLVRNGTISVVSIVAATYTMLDYLDRIGGRPAS